MTGVPDHEPSGPPGLRGVPDDGFCNELGEDWDLGPDREPPSEGELHGVVFDPGNSPVGGWEVMPSAARRACG
jgi:hypothetical protein